jgi:hypothetical protein
MTDFEKIEKMMDEKLKPLHDKIDSLVEIIQDMSKNEKMGRKYQLNEFKSEMGELLLKEDITADNFWQAVLHQINQ